MAKLRLAVLVPVVALGHYWQPIIKELSQLLPETRFFTGKLWSGFDPNSVGADLFQQVGHSRFIPLVPNPQGYSRGVIWVSPAILAVLGRFRPQVVFTSAFSLWTLLVLLAKDWYRWRVVIIYDGSSPNTNFQDARLRSTLRRWMAGRADALMTNSQAGKGYLQSALQVPLEKIVAQPYLVPDLRVLRPSDTLPPDLSRPPLSGPVFLYIGQIIPRKGLKTLLEACQGLQAQGYRHYSLLVIGDGPQRPELEAWSDRLGLSEQITWAGWVPYAQLGAYLNQADVLVFPTFEDVWGMVVLEAMALGKAILCSRAAAVVELIQPGENGYCFEPGDREALVDLMRRFLLEPALAKDLGQRSLSLMADYTPTAAAHLFATLAARVWDRA